MSDRKCPGCGGKISRRARLCRDCYKRAVIAGMNLLTPSALREAEREFLEGLTDVHLNFAPQALIRSRTAGQNRAYHAKCGELARLQDRPQRVVKRWALEQASARLGREIPSSSDLNEDEMSDLLDLLDDAIASASGPD